MTKLIKKHTLIIDLPSANMEWNIGEDTALLIPHYNTPRENVSIYSKIKSFWGDEGGYKSDDSTTVIQILLRDLAKKLNDN